MAFKSITPLTYPGGKSKKWKLIKSYFPKDTKDMIYIEPFFGGGSIGLNALNENLFKKYIYSDYDNELISFWKALSNSNNLVDSFNHFNEKKFFPNINLFEANQLYKESTNPLDFVAKTNLTFNGQRWGTFTELRLEQNWNFNKRKRIFNCQKLLIENISKISFWNENYLNLINKSKEIKVDFEKEILFYLDPPYFKNKGKPYKFRFKDYDWKFFVDFLNLMSEKKNIKFILSIDDCYETRHLFKNFNISEEKWIYTSTNTKGNKKCKLGNELIITNFKNGE